MQTTVSFMSATLFQGGNAELTQPQEQSNQIARDQKARRWPNRRDGVPRVIQGRKRTLDTACLRVRSAQHVREGPLESPALQQVQA